MKKRIIFSLVSLIAVLCMAAMASAGSVTWNVLTHTSKANAHPGNDGLMGTADDVAGGDTRNTSGSFAVDLSEWAINDGSCPANDPGPDEVAYGTGTTTWCMGAPTNGQIEWTNINMTFSVIPQYGFEYKYRLTPGGGPNTGSPCGTGTVNSIIDMDITLLGATAFQLLDQSTTNHVFAVGDLSPGPITCSKVDGGTATYSTQDLLAIEALLPGSATAYMVTCDAKTVADPSGAPCFDGMTGGTAWVYYTDGAVTTCDDDCGGGSGCMAGTAENVD